MSIAALFSLKPSPVKVRNQLHMLIIAVINDNHNCRQRLTHHLVNLLIFNDVSPILKPPYHPTSPKSRATMAAVAMNHRGRWVSSNVAITRGYTNQPPPIIHHHCQPAPWTIFGHHYEPSPGTYQNQTITSKSNQPIQTIITTNQLLATNTKSPWLLRQLLLATTIDPRRPPLVPDEDHLPTAASSAARQRQLSTFCRSNEPRFGRRESRFVHGRLAVEPPRTGNDGDNVSLIINKFIIMIIVK